MGGKCIRYPRSRSWMLDSIHKAVSGGLWVKIGPSQRYMTSLRISGYASFTIEWRVDLCIELADIVMMILAVCVVQ